MEDDNVHSRHSCREFLARRRPDTASKLQTDHGRERGPHPDSLQFRKASRPEYWFEQMRSARKPAPLREMQADRRAVRQEIFAGEEEVEEVEEVKEAEDRKNRPRTNGQARFFPLLPLLPSIPSPPFFLLRFVYLLGAV